MVTLSAPWDVENKEMGGSGIGNSCESGSSDLIACSIDLSPV